MANKNVVFVVLTTTGGSFSIHVHITCCATGFRMLNNNKVIYTTTTTTELKIPENWPTQYPASIWHLPSCPLLHGLTLRYVTLSS